MQLAKVVGNVVSTQKDPNLVGCKLLIIKCLIFGILINYGLKVTFVNNVLPILSFLTFP